MNEPAQNLTPPPDQNPPASSPPDQPTTPPPPPPPIQPWDKPPPSPPPEQPLIEPEPIEPEPQPEQVPQPPEEPQPEPTPEPQPEPEHVVAEEPNPQPEESPPPAEDQDNQNQVPTSPDGDLSIAESTGPLSQLRSSGFSKLKHPLSIIFKNPNSHSLVKKASTFLLILTIVAAALGAVIYDKIPFIKDENIKAQIARVVIGIPMIPKTPAHVIRAALVEHKAIPTIQFDARLTSNSNILTQVFDEDAVDISAKGHLDLSMRNNPKLQTEVSLTEELKSSVRLLGKHLYFRLNAVADDMDDRNLLGQWVYIGTVGETQGGAVGILGILGEKASNKMALSTQSISGIDYYKLHLEADSTLTKDIVGRLGYSSNSVFGVDLKETAESLTMDIWVDAEASYISRVEIVFNGILPHDEESMYAGERFRINFNVSVLDTGTSTEIYAPTDALSLEEFKEELFGDSEIEFDLMEGVNLIELLKETERPMPDSPFGDLTGGGSELVEELLEALESTASTGSLE